MNPVFPKDFLCGQHPVVPGAIQWTYPTSDGTVISIVGGGMGLYGDGIKTFEMYDFRESEPRGYLTIEEINQHLTENPI